MVWRIKTHYIFFNVAKFSSTFRPLLTKFVPNARVQLILYDAKVWANTLKRYK